MTGTFDNWSQSLPLVKTSAGDFEITLPLQADKGEDKVLFKFVVDGDWKTSEEYEMFNQDGNINNVVYYANLQANAKDTRIPESGGLSTGVIAENVAATEPSVVVPKNPQEIKEFSEVSDVSAKDLNAQIKAQSKDVSTTVLPSAEGKQETSATGEAGIVIPQNASAIQEFTEVSTVDAKDLNAKLNGEKKTIKVKKTIKRNKLTGEETVVASERVEENEPVHDASKTTAPNKESTITKQTVKESKPISKTTGTPKKEKKGFFSKLKKLL